MLAVVDTGRPRAGIASANMANEPSLQNGHYHLDGLALPRVTRVLDVLAKPGLEAWKHRIGLDEARRVSDTATRLGTRVHRVCEDLNRGVVPEVAGDLQPFHDAYVAWLQDMVTETVAVERFVYHRRHLYGGTLDLLARLRDGRLMLVDLKSSQSPDMTWGLQLAAYAGALQELGTPIDGRMIVNLPSRQPGLLRTFEYTDTARDDKAWLACLRLYRFVERHKDDYRSLIGQEFVRKGGV